MMNKIWAGMILIGIVYGALTGRMDVLSEGVLSSAKEAVSLCITMCGVTAMWTGVMEIATASGLVDKMTKGIAPFVSFLFPNIPKGHKAREYISLNMIANVLGLGWAATPAGLRAMEELENLEKERDPNRPLTNRIAGNEMCNFLIINISSLQLIPVNIIAYRSQYGSAAPTLVVGPAIIATFINTIAAILYCKYKDGKKKR